MELQSEMIRSVKIAQQAADELHRIPEGSYEEYETTKYIRSFCLKCGDLLRGTPYELRLLDIGMDTGAVVYLNAGVKETVALRADIDAVSVDDKMGETLALRDGAGTVTFGKGHAHICGHDYHTATLLGVMDYFCRYPEQLQRNLVLIFQPAEECTSGARSMLDHGLMEKLPACPSRLFGIHNRPEVELGKIVVHRGALMAEKSNFKLEIIGRTGHGGEPEKCIDPMVGAGAFIMGAQTIVSRNVDPNQAAVCSVLSVKCGDEENFVPDHAVLTGSIRSFSHEVHLRMRQRLEQLTRGTMEAYECDYHLTWELNLPAIDNSDALALIGEMAAARVVGAENVVDTSPALGSDDFSVLGTAIPAFYYWVGSGTPGEESPAWHKPDFHVAEGYLEVAVALLVETVCL